ncbi:protein involved in sex pheromone biosynthesis [Pullulanibacillus pueri]|uniref:Putative lipoprotein YerH n=1 Tax=Pullulanibacillus pueri TaxID=1437324 RepID=A0A8J3EMJ2_9BACL|nr:CamS family sex pheromone protein [Pullulanibacillus pueri]MBM7682742.1 protein involved in sex pheromone biosynthesis [Pullulanibacillus pueri]GGH83011.1 putative lipoprotein YerH [Pullulanibacillus pueri]
MKRKALGLGLIMVMLLLVTTACTMPWSKDDNKQIVTDTPKGSKEQVTVIPQENGKDYRTIHSSKDSSTRGYITYGVNNRTDIDEIETGLMRLSKGTYDPDKYYFQSGQYISSDVINEMISRKPKGKKVKYPGENLKGLNPAFGSGSDIGKMAEDSPKELSYVLEQDYLTKKGKNQYKLGGISLAISMNSVYNQSIYYSETGKTYPVDVTLNAKDQMEKGKAYANKVLQRIRQIKGLENVPVFIGLYLESSPGYDSPGHFYSVGEVGAGKTTIDHWKATNEDNVLLPSDQAASKYPDYSDKFDTFQKSVKGYFSNNIGVIGNAFIKADKIQRLTINIHVPFYDETEIMSFTNYVSSLLQTKFPFDRNTPVEVYISNMTNQPESIIVKDADMDTPFVHVYQGSH